MQNYHCISGPWITAACPHVWHELLNIGKSKILDNKSMDPCKIPEFCKTLIHLDVPVYFTVSGTSFQTLCLHAQVIFMYFFQFLPEETGRNTFFTVSSILPGRNLFLPEVSEPWLSPTYLVINYGRWVKERQYIRIEREFIDLIVNYWSIFRNNTICA